MKTKLVVGLFLAGNALAVPTWASITFTDSTFNQADYSTTLNSNVFANWAYPNAGPDSSSALVLTRGPVKPIINTYFERDYFLNNTFVYDPALSGTIQFITFSQDHFWQASGSQFPGYISDQGIGSNVLIFQNNQYYEYTGSIYTKGIWETGQNNGLIANQFSLITDLATFALDPSLHPDFANGVMKFGMYDGIQVGAVFGLAVITSKWDNLSITVNSVSQVPLPASVWLFGSALLGVLGLKRKMS
jgi:hypothetical protein